MEGVGKPSQASSRPGGAKREKLHNPGPNAEQKPASSRAVITPTYVGQSSDTGLKALRLRPHHCLALNHLTADASSRKL